MFPAEEGFEMGAEEAMLLVAGDGEHRTCVEGTVEHFRAVEFRADVVDFGEEGGVRDVHFVGINADNWT